MTIHAQSIAVKHNIEVAHRLFELPGKCEQIHGHSMWVEMELYGIKNDKGILAGIEYGDLKKAFRSHLDDEYDHRLLLNIVDPWSKPIFIAEREHNSDEFMTKQAQVFLPGLNSTPGDPTTENISEWIANYFATECELLTQNEALFNVVVTVWETSVNMARTVASFNRASKFDNMEGR